jgi:hypothetical protein
VIIPFSLNIFADVLRSVSLFLKADVSVSLFTVVLLSLIQKGRGFKGDATS